jgi:hypothetical protein
MTEESDTTRDEGPGDDREVRHEEDAAAAEAGSIGGPVPEGEGDDEQRPVTEAGGGEAEGFELAEADLEDAASHGGSGHNPAADAFTDEAEESGAEYGEGDEESPADA